MFIKLKLILLTSLLLTTGCSQIINTALAPITIPAYLIMNATKKEPYYNPNYIVSKECSREILKIMTIETGISFSEYMTLMLKGMITEVIHTKTKKNDFISIGVNANVEDNNMYITLRKTKPRETFRYMISSSSNHLDLVLSGHGTEDDLALGDYMDTYRGHKIHALENCPIN